GDLAAHAVADRTEDEATAGAQEETDRERRERRQLGDHRIVTREEHGGEHGGRRQAVQVVVVVLHQRAYRATGDHLALLGIGTGARRCGGHAILPALRGEVIARLTAGRTLCLGRRLFVQGG